MATRFISAILGVTLLFSAQYFLGHIIVTYLSFIICLVAAAEFLSLSEKLSSFSFFVLALIGSVLVGFTLNPDWGVIALGLGFISLPAVAILCFHQMEAPNLFEKIQLPLISLLYVGLMPALGLRLLYTEGFSTFLYLLVVVFMGDVCAYFTGKYFGKKKIFPTLSPKKTIAGAIGGLAGSVLFGASYQFYYSQDLFTYLALSLFIGIFAQFGDFFESMIKRTAGKKDTSKLMPGHGGFLDRFDGVYFGAVVLYAFHYL